MGQALNKLEQRYSELRKNGVQSFGSYPSQPSYLNNNNHYDDYYIKILNNKSKAIKEYLSILDKPVDQSYENKAVKLRIEGVKDMNDRKYTVKEVAVLLNVSTRTVEKYISTGKLSVEWVQGKTGRIRLVTSEALQAMKSGEALSTEAMNESEDMKYEEQSCENYEPVDKSKHTENNFYEPQKISTQVRQPIPVIDVGRNIIAEVEEKILLNKNHIENLLELQGENFIIELDKQREYFEQIIAVLQKENTQLVKKVSRVDEFIEKFREKQKRPWWKFWSL